MASNYSRTRSTRGKILIHVEAPDATVLLKFVPSMAKNTVKLTMQRGDRRRISHALKEGVWTLQYLPEGVTRPPRIDIQKVTFALKGSGRDITLKESPVRPSEATLIVIKIPPSTEYAFID